MMVLSHKEKHDQEVCPFKLAICPARECIVRISYELYNRADGKSLKEDHDCQELIECDYCDSLFYDLTKMQEHIIFNHEDEMDKGAPRRKVPKRAAAQRCARDIDKLKQLEEDPRYEGVTTLADVDIRDQLYELSDAEEGESIDYDSSGYSDDD